MDELSDLPIASLQRLARGLLYDRQLAEDVVQEAWLAVLRKRPKTTHLAAWMRTAVRHLAHDARRQERGRTTREQAAARPEAQPDPTDALARIEVLRAVLDAVEALEEPYRAAIGLRFLEGLPPRAIARRLELPVNTVRSRVHRGLELLRKRLDAGERERERFLAVLAPFAGRAPWWLAVGSPQSAALALAGSAALVVGTLWLGSESRARSSGPMEEPIAELGSVPGAETAAPERNGVAREAANRSGERSALGGAWLVRGHVTRGRLGAFAGAPLRARLYAGYAPEGELLLEAELTSDAHGDFAWALEPPAASVRLEVEARPGEHLPARHAQLVPRSAPAPELILLECLPLDAELVGTVRNGEGHAVSGAQLSLGPERATESDSEGRYRLRVSSEEHAPRLYAARRTVGATRLDLAPFRSTEVRTLDLGLGPELVLRGTVRDERGAPIEGARVASLRHAAAGASFGTSTSDARGDYELVLEDGEEYVELYAHRSGFASTDRSGELLLDEADRWQGLLDPEQLDLVLGPGVQASGRVTDSSAQPLEGVFLSLAPPFHDPPVVATTDAEGRFTLPSLPRAELTISARLPGYSVKGRKLDLATDPGSASELEFVLEVGTSITGQVVDQTGAPLPWATVSAASTTTCTDDEGRFVLTGVSASARRVVAAAPGFASAELALGSEREDLVLRLSPSARLAGRVLDAVTGAPITRFTLRILDLEKPGSRVPWVPSSWTNGVAASDPSGTWQLEADFPSGLYAGLEVRADGYVPALLARVGTATDAPAEASLARLVRQTRVHGQVVDAVTGQPIEGAMVMRETSTSGPSVDGLQTRVRTDARGHFELLDVPTGPMYLSIQRLTHAVKLDGPFVLEDTLERHIELDHGATVAGQLLAPDGTPASAQEVKLHGVDGFGRQARWGTVTQAEGRFEFRNLAGGDYTLAVQQWREFKDDTDGVIRGLGALGYIESSPSSVRAISLDLVEAVRLEPHERRDVVLQARGQSALRGTLGGSLALPEIVPVSLVLLDEAGQPTPRARGAFAERGNFLFSHLEAGRYELRAEFTIAPDRKATGRALVDVPAEGEVPAHLELLAP